MKPKQIIKTSVDFIMTVLILLLMGYMITGQELHEWLGTAMSVLFTVHHILNIGWHKSLFKGKYPTARKLFTALDFLLFADMICLAVSGITMSGYVFKFLDIRGGIVLARRTHLAASYWGFVLMSAHIGLHANVILGMIKLRMEKTTLTVTLKVIVFCVSVFGVYSFIINKIFDYLFLRTAFVLFNYEMPKVLFFAEYIAMSVFFAAVFFCMGELLRKTKNNKPWVQ